MNMAHEKVFRRVRENVWKWLPTSEKENVNV